MDEGTSKPAPPPNTLDGHRWPPMAYWVRVAAALAATGVGFWLLGRLAGTLLVVVASFALAVGMQPMMRWLERRGVDRRIALAGILLTGVAIASVMIGVLLPVAVGQLDDVARGIPAYLETLQRGDGIGSRLVSMLDLTALGEKLSDNPTVALSALGDMASFAVNALTLLVVTPYFALEMPAIKRWIVRVLRPRYRGDFLFAINRASDLTANYILGNLAISLMAGVITFVGLSLIGLPYALALAAWVALTDLIPMVGALIGAVPVLIVAYMAGPTSLVWGLLLIVSYQQLENFVLAPRVMKRAVDLSPATVIIALLVGGQLAGLVGALLALPLAALTKILLQEFYLEGRIERLRAEVTLPEARNQFRRGEKRVLP